MNLLIQLPTHPSIVGYAVIGKLAKVGKAGFPFFSIGQISWYTKKPTAII
jgi:hypothetical protein